MTRKRKKVHNPLKEARLFFLRTGEYIDGGPGWYSVTGYIDRQKQERLGYGTEIEGLWLKVREKLIAGHIRNHPGTRPYGFWWFDANDLYYDDCRQAHQWPAEKQRAYLEKHDLLSKTEM